MGEIHGISATHPIFECPPALQAWVIVPTGFTSMGNIINTVKLSNFSYLKHLRQHGLPILEEE